MTLDIRWPMGSLFVLFGVLIAGYGFVDGSGVTGSVNINMVWGAVLTVFGGAMLWLARRASARK